jgi:hypothetical protein
LILASGSSTQDLLRITQTGTGNAFVVEDATNPDSSPFVIDNAGNVGIGLSTPSAFGYKAYVLATNGGIFGDSATKVGLYGRTNTPGSQAAGVEALAYGDSVGTYFGIKASAYPSDTPSNGNTYIAGSFYADGFGENAYALRLQDGSQDTNKILTSVNASGDTNWSSNIYVTSIIASASSTGDVVRITQTGTGNALVVEDSANPDVTPFIITAAGNVGVGTASPSTGLHVFSTTSGAVRIVDGTQQAGYVLTSDANGVATWQASSGGGTTVTNFGDNRVVTSTGTTTGLNGEANLTFDGNTLRATANTTTVPLIIASGSSSQDLLRITQTGTGSSLVVEDSSNPDTTPFIITADGRLKTGTTNDGLSARIYSVSTSYGIETYGPLAGLYALGATSAIQAFASSDGDTYGIVTNAFSDAGGGTVAGIVANSSDDLFGIGTYIGGIFNVQTTSFQTKYSVRLIDGTEGTNKVLVSQDNIGSANWQSALTLTGLVVSSASSTDLVRITQTGTGNALVVEDSANPDATPFIVHSTGNVGIGTASPATTLHVQGSMELTGTFSGNNSNFVEANLITQTVLLYMSNNT